MKKLERPTLEDVALAANVSTATISRSINEPDKVAKSTLDRIQTVIRELGYTPNFGGRMLASNRSNTIGAIIPTMANAMFASGLQAFQEELAKSSVTLLVASSGYSGEQELQQIRSLMTHGADALLLIGASRPKESTELLELRNIPYVISWCYKTDPARVFVGFDNVKAAQAMTEHTLALGHQRIAMIAGVSKDNDRARQRIQGVKRAVNQSNNASLISVIESPYSLEAGGAAFEQLMLMDESPTVIICGNDVLAAGAIVRAKQLGIRIPAQVSITGFDDINLATAVFPALTTVRVPHTDMGRTAARLLLDLLSGESTVKSVKLETEIITRDSLSPPPK